MGDFGASPSPTFPEQQGQVNNTNGCKDPVFAVLFYVNLIAIIAVAATYGKDVFTSDIGDAYIGFVYATVICSLFSLVLSGCALMLVMKFPETMLKASLLFMVFLAGLWVILAFLTAQMVIAIIGFIFLFFIIWYAKSVWPRIPFAAVNMTTAIAAIKANFGVVFFAFVFPILGIFWTVIWVVAFSGVQESVYDVNQGADQEVSANYGYLFLLVLSFAFTQQVLQNSVQVTIAGVVGTWWVAPEDNGCCSGAVCNSFFRTVTSSFGSICFGSLLVAIVRSLESLANQARRDGDAGIAACIAQCILSCIGDILQYFNKWAFVYVGIYGYKYIDAGKNVIQLFKNRGWDAYIVDNLVDNVVLLMAVVTGGVGGGLAIAVEQTTNWFEASPGDPQLAAFLVGFIVAFAITAILLSTISSGVNAVVVMFADAPAELERNYPEISGKMRSTWMETHPGSVN